MRELEEVRREVESIRDEKGGPIEAKIKDLVIGLRRLEIDTSMSCEGHLKKGISHPWVDVEKKDRDKLLRIVYWYNIQVHNHKTKSRIAWVAFPKLPRAEMRLMPGRRDVSLKELQDSAVEFGKKIQNLEKIP